MAVNGKTEQRKGLSGAAATRIHVFCYVSLKIKREDRADTIKIKRDCLLVGWLLNVPATG